jgi:hypothetical protein
MLITLNQYPNKCFVADDKARAARMLKKGYGIAEIVETRRRGGRINRVFFPIVAPA